MENQTHLQSGNAVTFREFNFWVAHFKIVELVFEELVKKYTLFP